METLGDLVGSSPVAAFLFTLVIGCLVGGVLLGALLGADYLLDRIRGDDDV